MYGFNNLHESLTVTSILARVSEPTLWRYYLGRDFTIGKAISAPYRKDNDPSFSLSFDTRGRIMFKDFGSRGWYGDVFDYIQLTKDLDFQDSLVLVNCDFNLKLGAPVQQCRKGSLPASEINKLIEFGKEFKETNSINKFQFSVMNYELSDLNYWLQFGVTKEILSAYNVYCVRNVYLNKVCIYFRDNNNPCYGYYFPVTKHVKFYFPLVVGDSKRRFTGNVGNFEDIQGYYQCRVKQEYSNKILILTKSMKDCMTLRGFGLDAMAIHGESHFFHEDFIRHIRKYYPKIISLYDLDATGVKGSRYLWREYKIPPYFIDRKYRKQACKDISDVYKRFGREATRRFLNSIIGSQIEF